MTPRPVYINAAGESLFGMFVHPPRDSVGTAAVVLRGGGYTAAADRSPLWTPLEERLGSQGYSCLRFDYHGVGESTGSVRFMRPDRTFEEDLWGVARWLEEQRIPKTILIGQCGGARVALSAAHSLTGLRGLVLIAPPVRDLIRGEGTATRLAENVGSVEYIRRGVGKLRLRDFADPGERRRYLRLARVLVRTKSARLAGRLRPHSQTPAWVSPRFLEALEGVIQRRLPILFVFGTSDGWEDFHAAQPGRLEAVLERAGDTVEVKVLTGKVHGRAALGTQEEMLDLIWSWLDRRFISSSDQVHRDADPATERR